MTDWKSTLLEAVTDVEEFFDEKKFKLQQRLGLGKLVIVPYLGHGTQDTLYLNGRVLRDKHISSPLENDSLWTNLVNMYKRYQSDEIPGARVQAVIGDVVRETVTDQEGYFRFELPASSLPKTEEGWYDVELTLLDYPGKEENTAEPQEVKATGKVTVPSPKAQFGVISDIDDTVLRTDVLDIVAMARNTFFENAHTRLPFAGVAAFYQALRRGKDGANNPIYYVSSAARNLYDMLHDFFVIRGIPVGPLFLVDMGIDEDKFITPSHHQHKVDAIQTLLDTHPDLPFILIGDSTQKDPEIYHEIVKANPGRIKAIYIRDVTSEARDRFVHKLVEETAKLGVEMLPVKDTVAAAVHASTHGFIDPEALPTISEDTAEDKKAPTPLEEAVLPGTQAGEPRVTQKNAGPGKRA